MCCKSHHAVAAAGQPVDLAEGTAIDGRSVWRWNAAAPRSLNRVCDASSVCRMLRPAGGRIFELLLAAVWRCIEQHARIAVMLGATRVRRIGVKHVVTACEEDAQPVLFAE